MTAPARIQSDSTLDLSHEDYRFPREWDGAEIVAHFDHYAVDAYPGNNPSAHVALPTARLTGLTVRHTEHDTPLFVCADECARYLPVEKIEEFQSERI